MLGPFAMRRGPAKERVEAAEKLSRGEVDYLNKSVDPRRAHTARGYYPKVHQGGPFI